jgi:uncharacterized lipoprotein YbaY
VTVSGGDMPKARIAGRQTARLLLALVVLLVAALVPIQGLGVSAAQVEGDATARVLATALRVLEGVPVAECPAENPDSRPCVSLMDGPDSLARGVARVEVTFGPSQPGSYVAVFGKLADGAWGYWFGGQDRQPELDVLPGDLLACAGQRGAPAALLSDGGSAALAPLTSARAERFVLAAPGHPGVEQARPERGYGWYQVSAPRLGWVSSLETTDASFGDCAARAATLQPAARMIVVETPRAGARVSSPFDLRGHVSTSPFESTLVYRVYDGSGQVVGSGPITVQSEMGTPGPFAESGSFEAQQAGPGRIEVFEPSAAGGAPLATASLEITLVSPGASTVQPDASVTGVVTYTRRIALPPNAVVSVALRDVSRADAPAVTLGEQIVETEGRQVPIPFEIPYDPSAIDPTHRYAVSARITVDGELRYLNTSANLVLTYGYPSRVEVVVDPVR